MENTDFEHLNVIRRLVMARIQPGVPMDVDFYFLPVKRNGPSLAYIGFKPRGYHGNKFTHRTGIDRKTLSKTEATAYWVVQQMSREHPNWFIPSR